MDIDPPSTASGSDHAALESTGGEAKTYDEMWYETSKGLQKPVRFLSSFSNYVIFSSFESDRSQIYFATNFMYQKLLHSRFYPRNKLQRNWHSVLEAPALRCLQYFGSIMQIIPC